ncbi:MAG: amidohydrolase family protein [Pseudomonadota bacterium]
MLDGSAATAIDYASQTDRLVIAMLDRLWLVSGSGGDAVAISPPGLRLSQPQFSPNGQRIIASGGWEDTQQHLWQLDIASGALTQITQGLWRDHSPTWSADGTRLAFVSDRGGSDDIWVLALNAGTLASARVRSPRRLSSPVWVGEDIWYLESGPTEDYLQQSLPDGRRISHWRSTIRLHGLQVRRNGITLSMLRGSNPRRRELLIWLPGPEPVMKIIAPSMPRSSAPIAWRDRNHYFAIENETLTLRRLAATQQQAVRITGWLSTPETAPTAAFDLGIPDPQPRPNARWVLRAARVLSADGFRWKRDHDIEIVAERIASVVPQRSWPESVRIIDLGDIAVIPGLIALHPQTPPDLGLASGITSKAAPEPDWLDARPITDARTRLAQMRRAMTQKQAVVTDRLLPDVAAGAQLLAGAALDCQLWEQRWARETLARTNSWRLTDGMSGQCASLLSPWIVVFARNMIAEMRRLNRQGVTAETILNAATRRAARLAGRDDLGLIDSQQIADLLIVTGDPLATLDAVFNPIAIVSRGQFFSRSGLEAVE